MSPLLVSRINPSESLSRRPMGKVRCGWSTKSTMLPSTVVSVVQVMPTGLFSAMYTPRLFTGLATSVRATTTSPSTFTMSPSRAFAPIPTISSLIVTRPAASSSSASRREQMPASLMYLLTRIGLGTQAHATLEQAQGDRRQAHHEHQHHHEGRDDGHVADAEHAEAERVDHVQD